MREAKAECLEWGGEDSDWECFEIILPVTVIMPDGSIMIISTVILVKRHLENMKTY